MHTFLTPDPITIEIRNASGDVRIDLADVATTTVDVVASASHPLGFLDDVFRAVAAKAQSVGVGPRSGSTDRGPDSFAGGDPLDDPTERVRVDLKEAPEGGQGETTLIVDTDPARDGWKSAFTVHVTAPTASGIRIQSQSADVTVTGRADRFETRTASGDVRVDEVTGRSVVQTASGDVTIKATAECDLRTASGDIDVHAVTADAVVHSTSGDVRLASCTGNVNARSVSGDVRVLDVTSGRTEVVTVSGNVEIGIHAGSLTAVDLSTVSGSTDNDFEITPEVPSATSADDAPEKSFEEVAQEEPALDLRVKTTSGDIRLRRAVAV